MKKILFLIYIILMLMFIKLNGADTKVKLDGDVKDVLSRISPSVVKVVSENHRKYIATGVVIEPDLVLSNIKVVGHRYDRIYIETVKGERFNVKIVGKDKNSSLILFRTKKRALKPVKRGGIPSTGDWIGLVGVFYKQFPFLNQGIISSHSNNDLILNATVAPGSTGGAVINKNGEFIGIIRGVFGYKFFPQYIFKDNQSELKIVSSVRGGTDLCYALPAGRVFRIVKDLKKFGHVKRGWLGVNISRDKKGFVVVDSVIKKSPAEAGGILKGDTILNISGKKIKTPQHLSESIKMMSPGDRVIISVKRRGKGIKVNVKLAELNLVKSKLLKIKELKMRNKLSRIPEMIESIPKIRNYTFEFSGSRSLGVDVIPLTPELAKEFKVKGGNGLLVSRIKDNKTGIKSQLKIGDILINANGINLVKISDLARSLEGLKAKEKLTVKLSRKGKLIKTELSPFIFSYKTRLLDEFSKKFSEAQFWMEKQQQLKMKEEIEKYEAMKLKELKEQGLLKKSNVKIEKELKKLRKKRLEKYKKEIERLIKEKKAMERELKKIKEKKDDPDSPSF